MEPSLPRHRDNLRFHSGTSICTHANLTVAMSAINFSIQEDSVVIAADTLSLTADDKVPQTLTPKFFYVPNLQGVITGTGIFQFVLEWYRHVLLEEVARDIGDLDGQVQKPLSLIWDQYRRMIPEGISTTIYHFGYSEDAGRFMGYGYHSGRGFESRRLPDGLSGKPAIEGMFDSIDLSQPLPEVMIRMIEEQKVHDESLPVEERLGIGGEVQFLYMNEQGAEIRTIHRFDDYEDVYREIDSHSR